MTSRHARLSEAPANYISDQFVSVESPSKETFRKLGITGPTKGATEYSLRAAKRATEYIGAEPQRLSPQSNEPAILSASSPASAAVATTIGGRDTQFDDVELLADWDGREDLVADRQGTVDDFSQKIPPPGGDWTLTRVAVSAHSVANGFSENIFYYGDSFGNLFIAQTPTLGTTSTPLPPGGLTGANIFSINLPTALAAFGTLLSDDQIVVTGLAVNPVADLTSFATVNPAFSSFAGLTGEILYVAFTDTGSGFRLTGSNTPVRSGLLAFPVADIVSAPATPPAIQSPAGFPVQVGGAFGVAFSVFSNIAGCTVDDDGSIYFQQVDLSQFTGGNIVKVTDTGTNQDRSAATSGILTITSLNPTQGVYPSTSGPATQVNRFTNYSGTSTLFGNIASLWAGAGNAIYAAVARSTGNGPDSSSGLFPAPPALASSGTPSMIISFADCAGAFDVCSGQTALADLPGTIPIGDGIADVAARNQIPVAGVNNFRVFALGIGPDIRNTTPGSSSAVKGTVANILKIDFQVDYTIHSGIMVDEVSKLYLVSGGTPGAVGTNPSPTLGEIVVFEDHCPSDRRADFVDLRGNGSPNPPSSGGNVGDGDADIFDLTFWRAPIDVVSVTPTGLAGLSRGFLRYLNRTAPNSIADLPNGATQGDDSTAGPILFESFDPGHQVAGGDDQNPPFTGDDFDAAGFPAIQGPLSGGFEFIFGASSTGVCQSPWNGFFLNANGNITFGTGDVDNTPTIPEFRGELARIAPAWTDLNPSSRAGGLLNTFPLQALGFAEVNAFKIRWINVPEFGFEACGSKNTFSITLYDDGTGLDENTPPPQPAEGPTDLRWTTVIISPTQSQLVGCPQRLDGTGHFFFDYGRMDLIGASGMAGEPNPVITGYSIGGQNPLNPPGLCETNLSSAASASDTDVFFPCLIPEGTEPHLFELFNEGRRTGTGPGGEFIIATPDFDLRFEGNDAGFCSPARQTDANRSRVGFFGISCSPPPSPICGGPALSSFQSVIPLQPVAVAPGQPAVGSAAAASRVVGGVKVSSPAAGIINALCAVQLGTVGCGFRENETTIICQGFSTDTGIPLQRPGKIVTTSQAIICDTNGDQIPDSVITVTGVTPVNQNLVRGTLPTLDAAGLPGTPFPLGCCGGIASLTTTTTFTSGDNNRFGPFTLSTSCSIDLGVRAPVVISISPSEGDCSIPQNTIISGACFILPDGSPNVTSVFAEERNNPSNRISATSFQVLGFNIIDALFTFTTANRGKTFLIFVSGPSGTSRNLISLPAGTSAGCPLGNEQGIQVTFTCSSSGCPPGSPPGTPGCPPPDTPVVLGCRIQRKSGGAFVLSLTGSNFKAGATATIRGTVPRRIIFRNFDSATNSFERLILKGGICNLMPGVVVVTNPGPNGGPSLPFSCNERCPAGSQ